QRTAQVPLLDRKEARAQLTVGGEPNAVAATTKRLRDGVDEPDFANPIGEGVPTRGAARLGWHPHQRHEVALDDRLDLIATQHTLTLPVAVCVQWHELDEPNHVGLAARQLSECDDLGFGEVPHGDDVYLDGRNARVTLQRLQTSQ